jgi:hypothetical protein
MTASTPYRPYSSLSVTDIVPLVRQNWSDDTALRLLLTELQHRDERTATSLERSIGPRLYELSTQVRELAWGSQEVST